MSAPVKEGRRPNYQFSILGLMLVTGFVAACLRFPAMLFFALPLLLYVAMRMKGVKPKWRIWAAFWVAYVVAYPFTAGPVFAIDDHLGMYYFKDNRQRVAGIYRPIFAILKHTPIKKPLWNWVGYCMGGTFGWDPLLFPPAK